MRVQCLPLMPKILSMVLGTSKIRPNSYKWPGKDPSFLIPTVNVTHEYIASKYMVELTHWISAIHTQGGAEPSLQLVTT